MTQKEKPTMAHIRVFPETRQKIKVIAAQTEKNVAEVVAEAFNSNEVKKQK